MVLTQTIQKKKKKPVAIPTHEVHAKGPFYEFDDIWKVRGNKMENNCQKQGTLSSRYPVMNRRWVTPNHKNNEIHTLD